MVELNLDAGNVISGDVHRVGILALGSHLENHGPALPIDTDAKIASYVALEASLRTGAKFLGIIYGATEFPYVKHGIHIERDELLEGDLKPVLRKARKRLNIDAAVIVNGHGGNQLEDCIDDLMDELDMEIIWNNRIVEIEGPHAGSGEVSAGIILGIADLTKLGECRPEIYPEIGMIGLREAREANKGIDRAARICEKEGINPDPVLGQRILDDAIESVVSDVRELLDTLP
ncbi:2-amino-5-formylamino-6-ribosylaminopyrimidin-4(3H)-one 5'-monophosphate deformylase [Methanothermobacter sp.]|uniref:2-amino-5-formylamino-6-ribosylaminopyrimidin- 4(3H)-one 5'-monophosphate deformylase n=1 Tax=Methanothermobacter sp. TaxID=1884223 RepID=UPI0026103837|nr:2-amino-5-formylamino-6-ribosylaminopyrimidin-4(3H)-one 5'-monophosphate deformylase [Methanothermobacter sp.]MDI9618396.1 2-amino-5-formylamino-6-ribosylaminopyrimidin-4(3H)-one 5'-monophosphate deformylase [Methanothermobacter sp.]